MLIFNRLLTANEVDSVESGNKSIKILVKSKTKNCQKAKNCPSQKNQEVKNWLNLKNCQKMRVDLILAIKKPEQAL